MKLYKYPSTTKQNDIIRICFYNVDVASYVYGQLDVLYEISFHSGYNSMTRSTKTTGNLWRVMLSNFQHSTNKKVTLKIGY